uniref:Uncharacterized protein n=1 Tax=Caenorhabditis japonica TaxID=281687 RepID=A0A8R1EMV8_CAEJA
MVYSLAPGTPLTYAYLNEHVFPVTKHFFINPKANLEPGAPDDDDSMSGNSSLEEREPYKLFIATTGSGNNALPLPLPPTNDPVVFPEENDERRLGLFTKPEKKLREKLENAPIDLKFRGIMSKMLREYLLFVKY